jgi:hypothetical protein
MYPVDVAQRRRRSGPVEVGEVDQGKEVVVASVVGPWFELVIAPHVREELRLRTVWRSLLLVVGDHLGRRVRAVGDLMP